MKKLNQRSKKTLDSMQNSMSYHKIFSNNSWNYKNNVVQPLQSLLPEKYHLPTIIRFLAELILRSGKENNLVQLGSRYLKTKHGTVYRQRKAPKGWISKCTPLTELVKEKIIISDNHYVKAVNGKTGKSKCYKLGAAFTKKVRASVIVCWLENTRELIECGFQDAELAATIQELILKNDSKKNNFADNWQFTDKWKGKAKLNGNINALLENGRLSGNYLSRRMLIKLMERSRSEIEKWREDLTYDPLIIPPPMIRGAGVMQTGYRPYSNVVLRYTASYHFCDCPPLESFPKLLKMFVSTSETCNQSSVLFHRAPLKISFTGRVFETNDLGTTGLSKLLKSQNYEFLAETIGSDLYNYDLRSSQVSAICQYGDMHGYKFPYLEKYTQDKSIRNKLAKKVGISPKLLKVLILIKMFGGSNSYSDGKKLNSYTEAFIEAGYSKTETSRLIDKFNSDCLDLLSDINKWLNQLVPHIMQNNYCSNKKDYYDNGVTIVKKKFLNDSKKQSAFLLQGLEALYIFEIMRQSNYIGSKFYCLSYEFDGIITIGQIPAEAMRLARVASGFKRAKLELKPIDPDGVA